MSASSNEHLRLSLQAAAEQTLREACARTAEPVIPRGGRGKLADDTLGVIRRAPLQVSCQNAALDIYNAQDLERVVRHFDMLSSILDASKFVVLLDQYGRIVRVNTPCKTVICGQERIESEVFWDVFCGADQRVALRSACDTLRRTRSTCEWEGTCPSHDAHEHTIRWKLTTLDQFAAGAYVIAVGNDLTEHKQLKAQVLASDRLAAMGTLAAGMGHEINNPLAYLMMSLELAARTASGMRGRDDSADARRLTELLRTASEGAERIRVIVDELRTMARADVQSNKPVDVCTVLDSCAQIASNEIRHRARLVKEYGDVPLVTANANRLSQVFLNLIINAAQSIPEGHAAENVIRLVVHEQNGLVLVEVHDSGAGIEPDHKAHLFDPFFTTKPMGEGLGLGLSVCRSIVADLEGSIDVESEPEKGSMFRVSLRAAHADPPLAERVDAKEARGHVQPALRILIVDDEVKIAEMLAVILDRHAVTTASNCRDALRACARKDFDLILCDVQMPEQSGEDFYRELSAMRPGYERRVVFMTGGAFTQRARDFVARIDNRVLRKPFSAEDLLALTQAADTARIMR